MSMQATIDPMRIFFKNMLALIFSSMTMTLMGITSAIVIVTGESVATCITFSAITIASIAATTCFTVKVGQTSK